MMNFNVLYDAIIQQAAMDYLHAVLCGEQEVKDECVDFFESTWYAMLTTVKPSYLISMLNRRAEAMRYIMDNLKLMNIRYCINYREMCVSVRVKNKRVVLKSRKNVEDFIKGIKK